MLTETKTNVPSAGHMVNPTATRGLAQSTTANDMSPAPGSQPDPFLSGRHIPISTSSSQTDVSSSAPHRAFADSRPDSGDSRNADRTAFISNLAIGLGHDIGNIVLPMLCYLDSLDSLDLPADARSHVKALRESAMHLKRLSNGLNLFAHDSGDWTATAPQTYLHLWWREIQPIARKSLSRRVSLTAELPDDLPPVNCPAHQLTLAVINLINNAGEAISDRGTVRVSAQRNDDHMILLRISDTGHGMSEDIRRRALDPFFTTKRRALSTGLGLTQVNDIVKAAGGRITIESSVGQGTTVTLALPQATIDAATSSTPRQQHSAAIVMHDLRIASYARTLLEDAGFSVHTSPEPQPSDSLLVVEGERDALRRAEEFVGQRTNRRAIVVSTIAHSAPLEHGVVVIDQSHRALQRELQRAARDLF